RARKPASMVLPLPLELPVLPAPRERALIVLMDPDASLESYLAVVEGDPALTAAVLRAANSAHAWPIQPARNARDGVVRLGATAVRHLITATLVRSEFASVEAAGLDTDELWRHLLGCALLAEAQAPDEDSAREAFTAGLVHDLGRLAMAAQAPTRYRQVIETVREGHDPLGTEQAAFGINHAEFGLLIAQRWRLPEEITVAIGTHHRLQDRPIDTPPPPGADAAGRLALARWLMHGLGIGDGMQRNGPVDPVAEAHPLIIAAGGRPQLMKAVRWFRGSTRTRYRPAA
ncbi:MAG: HDOD domain-containing protein, partial [Dehalococcoidia bacterium]